MTSETWKILHVVYDSHLENISVKVQYKPSWIRRDMIPENSVLWREYNGEDDPLNQINLHSGPGSNQNENAEKWINDTLLEAQDEYELEDMESMSASEVKGIFMDKILQLKDKKMYTRSMAILKRGKNPVVGSGYYVYTGKVSNPDFKYSCRMCSQTFNFPSHRAAHEKKANCQKKRAALPNTWNNCYPGRGRTNS